ncbi:hypothetical protein OB08_12550 [Microbacterium sp. HJ5]
MLSAMLLVVLGVVWLLVAQPWSGSASEGTPAEASDSQGGADSLPVPSTEATRGATPADETIGSAASPSPSPSGSPAAQACTEGDVTVEAVTSADSYSGDQKPAFSISLTNNGSTDCTLNVGTSGQSFTVTSGSDVWWRSTDCQSQPSEMIVLLTAGQTVSSASPLTWDRTRSAVGTCDDDTRPRAPGGGASYHLAVEIGGIASTETAQFLLY